MLKLKIMQDGKDVSRRTKVVFMITKGVWGGAQKYVYNLATNLPKDKFDVTVIIGEGNKLEDKLLHQGIDVKKIKNLKRDISILSEIKSFFSLLFLLWKLKPDVLHLNSSKAGGIGALAGRILRIKHVVFTAHGFAWNENRKTWEKILITLSIYITVLLCHKTIVINEKEERQAKDLPFIKDDKIKLIKNGIEKMVFIEKEMAKESLEEKIGRKLTSENESITILGTISELTKNKGLTFVLSALSKVTKPFVFIILGEGEERKNLEEQIKKYNLEEKVFMPGFVDEANKFLKVFDVFTLTSIKEGLPYSILEAGLAEVPVVASSVGGIPDIVDSGENGILVTVGKPGEITRAIEYMINNPKEKKRFAKNLKEKIEKEFSLDKMIKETQKLYS